LIWRKTVFHRVGEHRFGAEPGTAAFVRRLHELGWIEGRTIATEYRWEEGRF
jgi:hypothetical protein